jgi:flagellar secretion chaperone FliS
MSSLSNTADAYLKTRVLTASPERLRLMLLDGAIKFARQGQAGLRARDFEASYEGFSQSRAIVMELIVTIESGPDPILAGRVKSVLSFIYSQMVDASVAKDPDKMEEPIRLLEFERETWAMFIDRLASSNQTTPDAISESKPDSPQRSISFEA